MKLFGFEISRNPSGAPAMRVEPSITAATTSGTKNPSPEIFDIGFGSQSRASRLLPAVSPALAERHATVFSCCNIIAGDLAKVPMRVWQRDSAGREKPVEQHGLNYLLNVEASPGVPAKVARFAMVYPYALRGNSVHYAPRDGGGDVEMIDLIDQNHWQIYRDGRSRVYEFTDGAEVRRRVPARSMMHFRYMALDGWDGRSPLQVAADSVGIALAGQNSAARTLTGSTSKAYIKLADDYEDDEARARNARRVKATLRGEDGEMPVLGEGEDIKTLDLSAADQELLSSRKFDREMIAAIYRMPPSKLQMLEHGVKANGQQQAIDYRTDCLLHWGGFVEAQGTQTLLTEAERRAGMFLRHDYSELLQATTAELYGALNTAVGGPFMTPNEAQRIANLPVTDGDDKLNPAPNMTREDDSADTTEGDDDDDTDD